MLYYVNSVYVYQSIMLVYMFNINPILSMDNDTLQIEHSVYVAQRPQRSPLSTVLSYPMF